MTAVVDWPEVATPGAGVPVPAGPVLLAVDGNNLAHRAWHAYEKRGLADPDGRPIFAVYGLLSLLVGILSRVVPDAVVVGFDDPAGSVRRARYPGYKAGRAERSEDLHAQLDAIPGLLAELGVPTVIPSGLEADDVLASAAAAAERAGWRCVVATSDRDAFRLISGSTSVLRLASGLDNAVMMTPAVLLEQLGVTPGQYPDYCALVGDKSDNLPGVAGVGPKTAVKLLAACGSLDAALGDPPAAVAAVGAAYAARLATEEAAAVVARNRDLMAPVCTVPVDPAGCRPRVDGGTVGRVLRGRHMPALVARTIAVLCPAQAGPDTTEPDPPAAAQPRPDGVVVCRTPQCGAPIRLVWMETGGRMPVDAEPAEGGTLGWAKTGQGWRMRVLEDGEQPADGRRWVSHFATCARPQDHRKPARRRRLGVAAGPGPAELAAAAALDGNPVAVLEQPAPREPVLAEVRVETRPCCTPGHDGRRARLYAGGLFCDECAAQRQGRSDG